MATSNTARHPCNLDTQDIRRSKRLPRIAADYREQPVRLEENAFYTRYNQEAVSGLITEMYAFGENPGRFRARPCGRPRNLILELAAP